MKIKTITTVIVAFVCCGIFSVSGQVQFSNSGSGDLLSESSVTPGVNEPNKPKLVNIYSYGSIIFIQAPTLTNVTKYVTVYNIAGKLVYNQSNFNGSHYEISLDNASGLYIVRIQTGNKTYNQKVFIQ